jgi:hypothetical protein
MNVVNNKKLIICLAATLGVCSVQSQNMNSPYSVYGIGDIDHKAYNRSSGMASTGLAIRSSAYFIDNNPAAISGLPRSFFFANVSITGKASTYSGDPINTSNSRNKDMWIKRFALATKINQFWASAVGMGQFSNVNYKLTGDQSIEGSNSQYKTSFEGDGGLNEYYWTNAVSLGKHFSFGIKSSMIAGAINQSEILSDEILQSTITTKQQDYIGNIRFQAGAIYETALSKKWDFAIGARFSPKKRFSAERTIIISENGETIYEDDYIKKDRFYLPHSFAGGIALKHNKRTNLAVDYAYEDWSSLRIKQQGWQLASSHRISAGAEFSKLKPRAGQLMEYKFFQLGGYYNRSYLQVRNTPINEYGFTIGMGGVLSNSLLYSLSLEAGVKGTTQQKLIRERYIGITLNITYSDFLFSKGRKYE